MDLREKTWSFSSVKLFEQCPFAFWLKYVEDQTEEDNAFAQHGKFAHSLLERYFKGELMAFELADVYENEYHKYVTLQFPYANIARSFYEKTFQYFQTFDGFPEEVIGVEEKLEGKFGDYNFVGYADLILRDDKGIIIVDHKSHAAFKNKKERSEYFRQLYLYAECVKQKYGEYPYKLMFNMFRIPKMEVELFAPSSNRNDESWFIERVNTIMNNKEWDCKPDAWYCANLCGMNCPYRG